MKKRMWFLLAPFSALFLCAGALFLRTAQIPDSIFLTKGSSRTVEFHLPFSAKISADTKDVIQFSGTSLKDEIYGMDEPLIMTTQNSGSTSVSFDLFGLIPLKQIEVTVGDQVLLYPGGQSIGVMLYTDGALIVGNSAIQQRDGSTVNPAELAGLKPGDIIKKVDGIEVNDAEHLSELVSLSSSHVLQLTILRDGAELLRSIEAVCDTEGQYKLGVWIRDSTAGVGTLTFYEPETETFAGLGHAITDADTGSTLRVRDGEIILSEITEVIKGQEGTPGELRGSFDPRREVLGEITKNTPYGIYGKGDGEEISAIFSEPMVAAARDEVCEGDALIYCSIDDSGVKAYSCRIEEIRPQKTQQQKSFVIRVTDPDLLSRTGGIVQGMSGSPIIQNDRIIGAVTHVFVDDPTRGYGVYIDWMLEEVG